jgi:leucyl/phenylalanyl-tRNA---protein transferase
MSQSHQEAKAPSHLFPEDLSRSPRTRPIFIGGNLHADTLIEAYSKGIFPWSNRGESIHWWCPDPRCVFIPGNVSISRSLQNRLNRKEYQVSIDQDFETVMRLCSTARGRENETWISEDFIDAYSKLHHMGYAHSFEVRDESNSLVGGLYGVSLGRAFFGESMFSLKPDASKIALLALENFCISHSFHFIDAQVPNEFLIQMGAVLISRDVFLDVLKQTLSFPTIKGSWSDFQTC